MVYDNLKAGIELILRNDKGDNLFAACVAKKGVSEPETIKLLAIPRGMNLFKDGN